MKAEIFSAHGNNYEIKVMRTGQELVVRAFLKGKPANGYSYNVTLETAHDLSVVADQDTIKELVAIAKNDVIEQR